MAGVVGDAEIELSPSVILLGGFAKPDHRLQTICRQAKLASGKCETKTILGLRIALFRLGAEKRELLADSVTLLGVGGLQRHNDGAETGEQSNSQNHAGDWPGHVGQVNVRYGTVIGAKGA